MLLLTIFGLVYFICLIDPCIFSGDDILLHGQTARKNLPGSFRWEEARHPEITALRLYNQGESSGSDPAILTVHGE